MVPRPNIPYDEKLYREGGLKETFASNFENGGPGAVYRHVEVKLPAIFVNKNGNWQIDRTDADTVRLHYSNGILGDYGYVRM